MAIAAICFSAVAPSCSLTSTLLEHGLADEVLLVVYPVLLGAGKRLLVEGTPARSLQLVITKPMPSGVILNHYNVVGPLRPWRERRGFSPGVALNKPHHEDPR